MDYETERKKHEIEDARQKMLAAWAAYEVAQATVRAAHDVYREKRETLIALQRAEIDRQNGEQSK